MVDPSKIVVYNLFTTLFLQDTTLPGRQRFSWGGCKGPPSIFPGTPFIFHSKVSLGVLRALLTAQRLPKHTQPTAGKDEGHVNYLDMTFSRPQTAYFSRIRGLYGISSWARLAGRVWPRMEEISPIFLTSESRRPFRALNQIPRRIFQNRIEPILDHATYHATYQCLSMTGTF
jgi:hypothetical protein